jgi:hypothetical protein
VRKRYKKASVALEAPVVVTRRFAGNTRAQQLLATARACRRQAALISIHLQGSDEGFLRDVDLPELAHLFLTLFLLVEKFAFPGNVAAIALRRHVFAQR